MQAVNCCAPDRDPTSILCAACKEGLSESVALRCNNLGHTTRLLLRWGNECRPCDGTRWDWIFFSALCVSNQVTDRIAVAVIFVSLIYISARVCMLSP